MMRGRNSVSSSRSRSRSRPRSATQSRSRGSPDRRSLSPSAKSGYRNPRPDRENPQPSTCIGIFNLDPSVDERKLEQLFDKPEFGTVEKITLIKDYVTRKSKGYAFVNYTSISAAEKAKDSMDGQEIRGKCVRVDFSLTSTTRENGGRRSRSPQRSSYRQHSPPPRGGSDRNGHPRYAQADPNSCLAIFNLPRDIDENTMHRKFKDFGDIDRVKICYDYYTRQPKGFGFVYYTKTRYAERAKREMDGARLTKYSDSGIRVDFSLNKGGSSNGGGRSYRSRSRSPRRHF